MSNLVALPLGFVRRMCRACIIVICISLPFNIWSSEQDEAVSENVLKAAYAFNFTQFLSWPNVYRDRPFKFCVINAKAEMQDILTQLDGREVENQVLKVIYSPEDIPISKLEMCQLIFKPGDEPYSIPNLEKGVVFVSFNPQADDGKVGIAMFFNREGKLRFSVNMTSLRKSGVDVSSQLLKLASEVKG